MAERSEQGDLVGQLAERLSEQWKADAPKAEPHAIIPLAVAGKVREFIVLQVEVGGVSGGGGGIQILLQDRESWERANRVGP